MTRALKWTGLTLGVAVGTALLLAGVQAARNRLSRALGRAEAIADRTRAALEETEKALHDVRTTIS
jgi:hypothetical protein